MLKISASRKQPLPFLSASCKHWPRKALAFEDHQGRRRMPQYLSQEWLDEFVTLAADQPTRPGATVKIQYKAAGGPAGDIDYYWVIDEGKILEAKLGTIDGADFTMTNAYDDAAKIQKGELEATAAFM